ncbi:hypothetical protein HPB47_008051 [Ixodes persulcatus]|uniref:Uncharacterized protein n=1 Tax=Ixodes persulcatus TaxID=34615 RepID=A0AC60P5R4_IXOPE|nr:hypothetical protein HPB47_008051 [Ixodes persulcatus]
MTAGGRHNEASSVILVESLVAYSAAPRRALESGSSGSDKGGELSSRAAVNRVRIGSLWATSAQRFLSIWRRPRTRGLGVIFSPFGFHTLQGRAFNLQGQVPLLPLRARPADLIDAVQCFATIAYRKQRQGGRSRAVMENPRVQWTRTKATHEAAGRDGQ